jgi:predicted ATPase
MRRYIITGAPGCGKTSILAVLKVSGYLVVDEAATDVIGWAQAHGDDEPWRDVGFVDRIAALQRSRQEQRATAGATVSIHDRSPICTLALAQFLGYPVSDVLAAEVDRVVRDGVYDSRVFFVRPLGFIAATSARRITYEDSLAFERIHEQVYRLHGFELIDIPPAEIAERASLIDQHIQSWTVRSG